MKSSERLEKLAFSFSRLGLLAAFILSGLSPAFGQYVLSINGTNVEMMLGEKQTVVLSNGQQVTVLLSKKDIAAYDSSFFSFRYKSDLSPSKRDLGKGINQTIMTSPLGTLVLAQEYTSLDPSTLIDAMAQALTKEEMSAGFTKDEKPLEKKLTGGKVLKGKIVTTTRRDDQWTRTIVACGNGDQGVLFVTMIENKYVSTEQPIIDLFWDSVVLKGF